MVGFNFCFQPKVISGLLQAGCTAWGYHGPLVRGSPDAWLFKDAGKNTPGRALPVYVPLQLCSTTVPGASRNDTALLGDYLCYRSENFWAWNVP